MNAAIAAAEQTLRDFLGPWLAFSVHGTTLGSQIHPAACIAVRDAAPAIIRIRNPRRDPMSLATIEALAGSIESAASWLKQATEEHLPVLKADAATAETELKRLQGSVVVQALEAAALTPAEEGMIAHVIAGLPNLRGAVAAPAVPAELMQATTPADVPPAADVAAEPAAQPA